MSNFSILQISALIGLFSLMIPIIIHLIHRSKGKVVWVGNIRLVRSVKKLRVTEVKLTQWLLLLIRLMLLALFVLLMAQVVYLSQFSENSDKRIYLTASWIAHATSDEITEIVKNEIGTPVVLVSEKLPKLNSMSVDSIRLLIGQKNLRKVSSDALVDRLVKENLGLENTSIYTTNLETEFEQLRHPLAYQIDWHVKSLTDEQTHVVNQSANTLNVLLVYEQSRTLDYQLLNNAFNYLADNAQSEFQFSSQTIPEFDADNLSSNIDWLIVLGELNIDEKLESFVAQGGRILFDSNLPFSKKFSIYNGFSRPIEVYRKINSRLLEDERNLISDAENSVLLSVRSKGRGDIFRIHSRFHPLWNDWIVEPEFAFDIGKLLFASHWSNYQMPVDINEAKLVVKSPGKQIIQLDKTQKKKTLLYNWLLLSLLLLLLLERIIAESSRINHD